MLAVSVLAVDALVGLVVVVVAPVLALAVVLLSLGMILCKQIDRFSFLLQRRTDRRTDGFTDGPSDGRGWTDLFTEMRRRM